MRSITNQNSQKPACCPSGKLTLDECGCCPKCAKGIDEECGGPFGITGSCSIGLNCLRKCGKFILFGVTVVCNDFCIGGSL